MQCPRSNANEVLHESYLELYEECVLCKGICSRIVCGCIGADTQALVVAEFVVKLDLGLNFRRKILEVISQADNGPGIHVVRHGGVGIELFPHESRFEILKQAVGDEILGQDVVRSPLHAWSAGSTADRRV